MIGMALLSVFIICKLNIEGEIRRQRQIFQNKANNSWTIPGLPGLPTKFQALQGPYETLSVFINEFPNTARNGVMGANRQFYDLKR